MTEQAPLPAAREPQPRPGSTDAQIDAALVELTVAGEAFNHDEVAERAGVSRRTVYRRFPDRQSLRRRVWELISPPSGFDRDEHWLDSSGLIEDFKAFESNEAASMMALSSLEGRAMRNALREQRVAAMRRLFEPRLGDLPEPQRTRALAVLQLLTSGLAWREMRDQWELDGEEAAQASLWAIRTLLRHATEEASST